MASKDRFAAAGSGSEIASISTRGVICQDRHPDCPGSRVLSAVSAGELAPGQGAQLLAAIGALARVAEIDELTLRITKLEQHHATK